MKNNFLADTALVGIIILGFVFIGGVVTGEASALVAMLCALCFTVVVGAKKLSAKKRAAVNAVELANISDFKHAA